MSKLLTDRNGTTLIEMLLALFVFFLISIFIARTIPLINHTNITESIVQEMDWEIFINFLKREIYESDSIYLSSNLIQLQKDGRNITYEKYNNLIRRKVDKLGHEPLILHIESVQYEKTERRSFLVTVTFLNGSKFQEEIFVPAPVFFAEGI